MLLLPVLPPIPPPAPPPPLEDDGNVPLKLCELCSFFDTGPLETPGFRPDFELFLELDDDELLLLLEPFLF